MTLRLVESEVSELPVRNLMDIGMMARGFADDLDECQWGAVNRALVIVERDEGLVILGWGESVSAYEMMGLFEAAKLRVFADEAISDE